MSSPTNTGIKLSILLPSLRQAPLMECLASFRNCTRDLSYEVVVVSPFPVTAEHVVHLEEQRQEGCLAALNRAYAAARGEYICYWSDDAKPTPGCFESIISYLSDKPTPTIASFRLLGANLEELPLWQAYDRLYACWGCASRATIDRLGGLFDPAFKAYWGDPDLAMRCWHTGGRVEVSPDSFVVIRQIIDKVRSSNWERFFNEDTNTFLSKWHDVFAPGTERPKEWTTINRECNPADALRNSFPLPRPNEWKEDIIRSATQPSEVVVSALVPLYNSEKFVRGLLADLERQTIASKCEIVIVETGSTQNEKAIIDEFLSTHKNITYVRSPQRENAHRALNKAIALARGKYLALACADDRHASNAFETMSSWLDAHPDAGLAYADAFITTNANEPFESCKPLNAFRWPEFDRQLLFSGNFVGPQPMWRKSLHKTVGGFDERMAIAGDYELWLRFSMAFSFSHIPEVLGAYLQNPTGTETSNREQCDRETNTARIRYWNKQLGPLPGWSKVPLGLLPQPKHSLRSVHTNTRIIALMAAYNEGDIIFHVIGDLIENGVSVYLIDNSSTDNTVAEASKWLGKGLLKIERFPDDVAGHSASCAKEHVWAEILRRKEELSSMLEAAWFLHVDADEFRESPWPGKTLAEAIRQVDALGYNAINFELLNFRPTNDKFVPGEDVRRYLSAYQAGGLFDAMQINAWRDTGVRVQLVNNGGHAVGFPGRRVFPLNFILRHYPIRGETHGRGKVFTDRLPRFAAEEVAVNWHVQHNEFADSRAQFLHDPKSLVPYDGGRFRAELLGRFSEDLLLATTVTGVSSALSKPDLAGLCSWIGRRLSMPAPLESAVGAQAEQMLAALLQSLDQKKDISKMEIDPGLRRLLGAVLAAKLAFARLSGDFHYASHASRLKNVLFSGLADSCSLASDGDEQARQRLTPFGPALAAERQLVVPRPLNSEAGDSVASQPALGINITALKTRALELSAQGNWSGAIGACAQVAISDPDDTENLFVFAHSLANLGAISDALKIAKRLAILKPDQSEYSDLVDRLEHPVGGIATPEEKPAASLSAQTDRSAVRPALGVQPSVDTAVLTRNESIGGRFDTDEVPRLLTQHERYLGRLVDRPVNLLKIGVSGRGSLLMWQDYFKKGQITSLDLKPILLGSEFERIHVYQGDQQDGALLGRIRDERAPEGFDIIIDDASHMGKPTRKTFEQLFDQHLKPGGVYVINDWGTGYWESFPDGKKFVQGVPHHAGTVGFVKELVDEAGMDDLSNVSRGGSGPSRESKFEGIFVTDGSVFIVKKNVPARLNVGMVSVSPCGGSPGAITAEHQDCPPAKRLLAGRFDTDKGQNFLDQYERHFAHMADQDVRLLEIGVFRGGSLLMWQDYFKRGQITGLDLNPVSLKEKAERIRIYQGYQQDGGLLGRIRDERAAEGFDIIIDDASHLGNLTRETFNHLFDQHLKPGGIYVIEDWGTGYWESFPDGKRVVRGVPHDAGMVGFIKELVDEAGMGAVTKPGPGAVTPARASKFDGVFITGGQVFILKKPRPGDKASTMSNSEEVHAKPLSSTLVSNAETIDLNRNGRQTTLSAQGILRSSQRIVALVSAYNEGDVIYHVVGDLIANGVDVYLIDNNSTDNTVAEATRWLGKGLLKIERFPQDAGPGYSQRCEKEYVWSQILRRKEELAVQLGADWYIHADADEFRESPWPGKTLAEAIADVDAQGYNAINFELLNFRPTDDAFVPGMDVRRHLTGYETAEILDVLQIKAWKDPGQRVQLVAQGGHSVEFPGRRVFPLNFILRHYPIRGESHGRRKVFKDRVPRFAAEEVARNWHIQYNAYVDGGAKFLHSPSQLGIFDGEAVRAKLLFEYAEDEKLVASLGGQEGDSGAPNSSALCAWVGQELGYSASLPLEMWRQAEQVLGQLLSDVAAGKKDLGRDIEPGVVRLFMVLLKVKTAFARFSGHVRLMKIGASLNRLLVARLSMVSAEPQVSMGLDARLIQSAEKLVQSSQSGPVLGETEISRHPDLALDEIFGPDEVQSFEQLATAFSNSPNDAGVSGQLRELQQGLMNFLVTAENGKLEAQFKGSLGRVFRALVASGLPSEPPSDESQAQLAVLDEALAGPESPTGGFDFRPLLARMLLAPAHRGSVTVALEKVPAWFLEEYLGYILYSPAVFVACGEAEQYQAHLLAWARVVFQRTRTLPNDPVTLKAAHFLGLKANSIPLYFSQSNTRELAEKRAAVMEFLLVKNGAAVNAKLPPRPKNRRKIKVGFLSAHFGAQTETHVTLPALHLDRSKFEICLFPVVGNAGPIEDRCRSFADSFTVLPPTLQQQVKTLRDAALDVVIIGTNVTAVANQVSLIALHRLAPLQLATYCSPVSTGMRHIDGYLSGTFVRAPGIKEHFSEKLHFCEGPPGCLDYTVEAARSSEIYDRASLGLAADDVVFINAAACFKILPEMQETWAKILKAVPKARLVLLPFNPNWSSAFPVKQFERSLTETFARHGLDRDRFILISSLPSRADVKELEKVADVYLDTFPFSGSISVIDPLELGLPPVVWEGATHRSRMAAALLRELEIPQLIATDEESYIKTCVALATDADLRRKTSELVRRQMALKPRFLDPAAYGSQLGALLEGLVPGIKGR